MIIKLDGEETEVKRDVVVDLEGLTYRIIIVRGKIHITKNGGEPLDLTLRAYNEVELE